MGINVRDYKTRNDYLDAVWEATKHYDRYQGADGRAVMYDEVVGSPEAPRFKSSNHYYNAKDQVLNNAPVKTSDWVPPASSWVPAPEARVPAPSPWQSGTPAPESAERVYQAEVPASRPGTSGLLPSFATAPQPMVHQAPYTTSYADRASAAMGTTTPRNAGNYSSVPESMMPSWMRSGSAPAPAPVQTAPTEHKGLLPALDREHSTVPEHLLPSWMRGQTSGDSDLIPPEWRGGTGG